MRIKVIGQAEAAGLNEDDDSTLGKSTSKRFIAVEHGNASLHWNFPPRTWINGSDSNAGVFDQINMYLATLDPTIQQGIFNEYQNIHNVLRSTNRTNDECEDLIEAIRPIAKRLFKYINPEHFNNWVWTRLRPTIPQSASALVFDPNTMPGTRERTYLHEDYKGLIPLAIILRMACPFWFDFAELTQANLNREHKDMLSYSLIEQAWPAKCPAMKRLEEFVDHTVGADRNNPASILLGIGSDDFVYWALSTLIINRMPVVDVMGTTIETPVVSALYNYIRVRVTTLASSQPSINNKFTDSSFASDENNQSYLEGFRSRIELTVGQEAYGDYYLERELELIEQGCVDPTMLIQRVAPGIDYALVTDALQSVKKLETAYVTEQQINIAAWLFHPYSQARATSNFKSGRIRSLLALAQAVLLHHGKEDLAILVTGNYERTQVEEGTHVIGEAIATLRASEKELYRKIFPLEKRSRNLRKVENFVMENVYDMVLSLQDYDINCTFSAATLTRLRGNNPNRRYFLRRDAVTMFMEYVKWLAERPVIRIDPMEVYNKILANKLGLAS